MNEQQIQFIKTHYKAIILVIFNIVTFATNAYLGYQFGQHDSLRRVEATEEKVRVIENRYMPRSEYDIAHRELTDKVINGLNNLEGDVRDTNQKVSRIYDYLIEH